MNRRTALHILSIATAGSAILPLGTLSGCKLETYEPRFWTKEELPLLNQIAETILPTTEGSPGAKSLKVANFMDAYIADCYTLKHQSIAKQGLTSFKEKCIQEFSTEFLDLMPDQQTTYLVDLDNEAEGNDDPENIHYFSLLKSLVLFTYFTSEEVSTKVLRYLPIPGKYVGNYPLEEGDTAWTIN